RQLAALCAPVMVALWVLCAERGSVTHWQLPLACAAATALLLLAAVALDRARTRDWSDAVIGFFAMGFTLLLAGATLFDIERQASAVMLELLCLAGLFIVQRGRTTALAW